ncbi:MAG: hypothetical protein WBY44_21030 [Bryobacteraceae bacterium]
MNNAQTPSGRRRIVQLDLNGLIIELEYFGIMLHLVYAGEFDPVTLELDRDTHLAAGVTAADVRPASTNPTSRIRCTDAIDQNSPVRRDADLDVPSFQCVGTQHWVLLETGGHDNALSVPAGVRCLVYFRDMGGSSFLSALTYRTPASLIRSWSKRPFSMAWRTSGTSLSGT